MIVPGSIAGDVEVILAALTPEQWTEGLVLAIVRDRGHDTAAIPDDELAAAIARVLDMAGLTVDVEIT